MLLRYTDSQTPNAPILVFIHGWPDTGDLWKKQVEYFSDKYRCICLTLPGFSPDDEANGADFPDVAKQVVATIKKIKGDSNQPVILVGHDWGAFVTYFVDQQDPSLATRLITMDVGPYFEATSFGHGFFLVTYQWLLMIGYAVSNVIPFLGNALTKGISILARAPRGSNVHAKMNYPYFYFWRAKFCKKYRGSIPSDFKLTKPILYLYGMGKRYHFHLRDWVEQIAATPGSRVVGIENCDHWFMVRDPAITNSVMDTWLSDL